MTNISEISENPLSPQGYKEGRRRSCLLLPQVGFVNLNAVFCSVILNRIIAVHDLVS